MDENTALEALAGLAQETRLRAFRRLVRAGAGGLAAGELAADLAVPQNTLSTHLERLTRAGLISRQREGRVIRYRADFDGMRALLRFLLEDCCQGQREICAPLLDVMSC